MAVTTIDYASAAGASTTTNIDAGTYSVKQVAEGLHIPSHDCVSLTYVAAGNGVGEIETITYKQGGVSGTAVAVVTLSYDANDKLATITKV